MNKICNLNFKFKGNRDYVQGPSIFDDVCQALNLDLKNISNLKLSIYNFLRTPSAILIEISDISSIKSDNLIALFEIHKNNKKIKYALFSDSKDAKIERIDFDESIIVNNSSITKNEIILKKFQYSFVENIVSLNKHLLSNIFSNVQGKWIFTKLDINCFSVNDIKLLKIVFESNFKNKIFKSSIFINSIHIGFIFFNLI